MTFFPTSLLVPHSKMFIRRCSLHARDEATTGLMLTKNRKRETKKGVQEKKAATGKLSNFLCYHAVTLRRKGRREIYLWWLKFVFLLRNFKESSEVLEKRFFRSKHCCRLTEKQVDDLSDETEKRTTKLLLLLL